MKRDDEDAVLDSKRKASSIAFKYNKNSGSCYQKRSLPVVDKNKMISSKRKHDNLKLQNDYKKNRGTNMCGCETRDTVQTHTRKGDTFSRSQRNLCVSQMHERRGTKDMYTSTHIFNVR